MAERPSLLFLLAHMWFNKRVSLETSDIESASIIQKFVDYCIERQVSKQVKDVSLKIQDQAFIPLRQSELTYFTIGCAVASLDEGRNNSLPEAIFRQVISDLWDAIGNENHIIRKPTEEGALSMPLRERFSDLNDPVEACQQAVRTHGVLELDPARNGFYKFSHKSFAEVLAASVVIAGALRVEGEPLRVWNKNRPFRLIEQATIFNFCHGISKLYPDELSKNQEHTVFSNILSKADSTFIKLFYEYMRATVKYQFRFMNSKFWKSHYKFFSIFFISLEKLHDPLEDRVATPSIYLLLTVSLFVFFIIFFDKLLYLELGSIPVYIIGFLAGVITAIGYSMILMFILYTLQKRGISISILTRIILLCYMIITSDESPRNAVNRRRVIEFDDIIRSRLDEITRRHNESVS